MARKKVCEQTDKWDLIWKHSELEVKKDSLEITEAELPLI